MRAEVAEQVRRQRDKEMVVLTKILSKLDRIRRRQEEFDRLRSNETMGDLAPDILLSSPEEGTPLVVSESVLPDGQQFEDHRQGTVSFSDYLQLTKILTG